MNNGSTSTGAGGGVAVRRSPPRASHPFTKRRVHHEYTTRTVDTRSFVRYLSQAAVVTVTSRLSVASVDRSIFLFQLPQLLY